MQTEIDDNKLVTPNKAKKKKEYLFLSYRMQCGLHIWKVAG